MQITDVEPSVSTAGSFLIIACFFAIRLVPTAKTIVTIDDSASGIAATATATENINESIIGFPLNTCIANIIRANIIIPTPSFFPKSSSLFCNGVCLFSAFSNNPAIFPISVFIPVPVTTTVPLPYTTIDPLNAIFLWSPRPTSSLISSVYFSTGSLSPVNIPSTIFKLCESTILPSAGT